VVENLAPLLVIERRVENWQLDAVVAQILEHLQDRDHRVVQLAGPQQQVHAEFHFSPQFKVQSSRFKVQGSKSGMRVQGPKSEVQSQGGAFRACQSTVIAALAVSMFNAKARRRAKSAKKNARKQKNYT